MKAKIILGLGFGDEGKGRTVDYLCLSSENPIVVRFSGGQQVGHTVILNGIKHIHSNYGSGSLRGIPTYYTEHCCAYLNSMSVELDLLKSKGITPRNIFHPFVKMTTPYDWAYNRLKESSNQHGSCGMGIGTTMKRNLETPYKLYAIDFKYPHVVRTKLKNIENYYWKLVYDNNFDQGKFISLVEEQLEHFEHQIDRNLFEIASYEFLMEYDSLIFEGSQGILLDMDHGFFPNVTYANTTSKNAIEICRHLGIEPEAYYVTRCYQTRHGNGWMSPTGDIKLINNEEEINVTNDWQGNFRIQEIDYDLLNYALEIDNEYLDKIEENIEKHLVVTCLDQRPGFEFKDEYLNQNFKTRMNFWGPKNDLGSLFKELKHKK